MKLFNPEPAATAMQYREVYLTAVVLCLISCVATVAGADELRLDARQLIESATTENLALTKDGKSIEFARGVLIEDDGPAAGYSYKHNEELLRQGVKIKKEFLIANPRANGATLLVAPGGDLSAVINGKACELTPQGKAGGYWQAYSFSPALLVEGKNEIVLSGTGKIWIARDDEFAAGSLTRVKHPNRSAKSTDGGKSWNYDSLGPKGDIDGEYYVRLFLDQVRPNGTLTLPVLEAGNLAGKVVAPPLSSPGSVRIDTKHAGSGGAITIRIRSGSTLATSGGHWTNWRELGCAPLDAELHGQYFQIALDFLPSRALESPRLESLALECTAEHADDWTKAVRVVESHNERIVRTSIPFEYEPLDRAELKTLRQTSKHMRPPIPWNWSICGPRA